MRPKPIAEILRVNRLLAPQFRQRHLCLQISIEKAGSLRKTSVRIRELEAALKDIVNKQLRRESRVA